MKLQKFDYQIKDNKNRSIVVVSVALVAIITGFIIYKSFAAYKVTESYNIIKGSVAEFSNESLKISYNLVGEDGGIMSTSGMPSATEYEFDATASSCVNGNTIVYDKNNNTITIGDNAEGLEDTCNIYFNFIPLSKQTLYALGYTMEDVHEGAPYDSNGTPESGFYAAQDNYGISYYFYGNGIYPPTISFGGDYGLLVRINGDGSVRIIIDSYNAISSVYNNKIDDNAYLGYMYGDLGSANILNTQSNNNNSVIKDELITYYNNNLATYSNLWGDAYFCNDRSVYKSEYGEKVADDTTLGTSSNITYYGAYYRLRNNTPSLMCSKNDAFTVNETDVGNGKLSAYVGILSIDEIYMTGIDGYFSKIFTMSPAMFNDDGAYYYGSSYGNPFTQNVNIQQVFLPVVNLKHGLTYTGDPSWFEVSE